MPRVKHLKVLIDDELDGCDVDMSRDETLTRDEQIHWLLEENPPRTEAEEEERRRLRRV